MITVDSGILVQQKVRSTLKYWWSSDVYIKKHFLSTFSDTDRYTSLSLFAYIIKLVHFCCLKYHSYTSWYLTLKPLVTLTLGVTEEDIVIGCDVGRCGDSEKDQPKEEDDECIIVFTELK